MSPQPPADAGRSLPRVWGRAGWGLPQWPPFSAQAIATLLILLVCGGLVIYPVLFLAEESLNVGDPEEFPLQEWGLGNFTALSEEWHVLANTALVASVATVMAVLFGFVVALILRAPECRA